MGLITVLAGAEGPDMAVSCGEALGGELCGGYHSGQDRESEAGRERPNHLGYAFAGNDGRELGNRGGLGGKVGGDLEVGSGGSGGEEHRSSQSAGKLRLTIHLYEFPTYKLIHFD